jgi:gliding motility-associated-like protein
MNLYFTKKIWILSVAIFLGSIHGIYAQCGFLANEYTGCASTPTQIFQLNIQDTTSGISPNSVNWTVTLPAPSSPSVIHQSGPQFSYTMTYPGTVTVVMTDTLGNGQPCTASSSNFTVYPNPVLKGSFSTTVTCVGACVYWHDSSAAGANCSPLTYLIDWGSGGRLDSVPGACHTYPASATAYSPVIYIENSCGCHYDTTFAHEITVTSPPSGAFTGTPLISCTSPLVSTMTATSPVANTKYYWYITPTGTAFPTAAAQASGSHTFTYPYPTGIYDIKLIAIDTLSGCSDSSTQSMYVNVGSNPAACFTASDTTGCDGKTITFTPCTNGAIKYVWNFPGGNPPTVTNVNNTAVMVYYGSQGTYSSQLIVSYPGGCVDTLTKDNIILGLVPTPTFSGQDTSSCRIPDTICVTYTGPACAGCTFSWNPPNNTTPTSSTGTCYIINSYGTTSPELIITAPGGCQAAEVRNNYLNVQQTVPCVQISYQNGDACTSDTIVVTNCTAGGPFANVIWHFPGANVISQNSTKALVTYGSTGCHDFTMVVQTNSGCIDTLKDSICIGAKPTISMAVSPHDLCYEAATNIFTITGISSADTPTSIIVWPEGIVAGAPIFTIMGDSSEGRYLYQNFGNFGFCYLAESYGCHGDTICPATAADSVHIYPPIAKIGTTQICHNTDSLIFINQSVDATSTYWTYNGMTYPNQDTFLIIASQCGIKYGVSLTAVNDTFGCSLTKSDTVAIPCYGVDFKFNKTKGCNYAFDTSANIFLTAPNVLVPSSVVWSVEFTGTPPSFSPPMATGDTVPNYALYQSGVYDACVQLSYSNGCVTEICKSKYIDISQPLASFTTDDSAGCLPFTVHFTNTSVDNFGAIIHYYWEFGDTANREDSTHANPSHTYTSVGQFQACLTIVDSNGCSTSYCRQIQANSIQANFTESDSITCTTNPSPLNPITYTNSSTGFVSSYQWILPASLAPQPSTQGNTPSITEQYGNQGYDSIGLVAIDQFGTCRDTVYKPVHVINPVANYGIPMLADTLVSCPPAIINPFTDSSLNDICTCFWDFGDGLHTDTACDASIIYSYPGNYCVKHVVTSCHGCQDSITKYCIDIKGPQVTMTASVSGGCPCLPVTYIIRSIGADSMRFTYNTANDGIRTGSGASFINFAVTPRGTPSTPTFDTLMITYCGSGIVKPEIDAIDLTSQCIVPYDSLIVPISIDTPVTNFSSHIYYCGADSVCFTNLTTFAAAPYAHDSINNWNFGDNTTSSAYSPCHTYALPGDYTVQLAVSDNYGCTDTMTQNIHVPALPLAAFAVNDSIDCTPFLVHFMDSSVVDDSTTIVSGYWNFGNNTTYNGTTDTSYDYTISGIYVASLVITDGYGCTDTAKHTVQVMPPPTIHAGDDTTICLGDTATLYGSGSSTLLWLTDYNIDNTSSATPHVWPRVDTFYILQVGTMAGCFAYDTVYVNVSTVAITLDTATNVCSNELTSFTSSAQTVHATIASYNWTFGDGSAGATGQDVTHQYPAYNVYTATLIVVNSVGCKDTDMTQVTIFDVPKAMLTASDTAVCKGAPVTLVNNSSAGVSGGLSSFYFSLEDGLPNDTVSPYTFTYPDAGSYLVLLVQTDQNQCSDSAEQIITVHTIPQANFNNDTSCIGVVNTYTSSTALGDGAISSYNWTVNGAQSGDSSILYYNFPDSSTNTICLNVSDIYGCKDTACKQVVIFSNPQITVTAQDSTICVGYSDTVRITGARFDHVQWVPSVWVSDPTGTTVVITPLQTIRYQVYGYYLQCEPAIDTVSIYVIDTVPITATADPENIVLGLSSNVTATVQGTIDSIVWDPSGTLSCRNCKNPIATPQETTTYYATIYYSKNGVTCSNRASVTITVYQSCDNSLIYIPNTFTPNGDGRNDVFRIRGQGITQVNYFRVYDRWGKLVYEADDQTDTDHAAWNGGLHNDTNKPENSGVYVYVFEVQCISGQPVTGKGNVTLIR